MLNTVMSVIDGKTARQRKGDADGYKEKGCKGNKEETHSKDTVTPPVACHQRQATPFYCKNIGSHISITLCIGRQIAKDVTAAKYLICQNCEQGGNILASYPDVLKQVMESPKPKFKTRPNKPKMTHTAIKPVKKIANKTGGNGKKPKTTDKPKVDAKTYDEQIQRLLVGQLMLIEAKVESIMIALVDVKHRIGLLKTECQELIETGING